VLSTQLGQSIPDRLTARRRSTPGRQAASARAPRRALAEKRAAIDPLVRPALPPLSECIGDQGGVPIDRAIRRIDDQEYSGRIDSMRAYAVASLAIRVLCLFAPPDEDEAVAGFRRVDASGRSVGKRRYVTLPWRVLNARFVTRFRYAGA
jgi:hypothetical protein